MKVEVSQESPKKRLKSAKKSAYSGAYRGPYALGICREAAEQQCPEVISSRRTRFSHSQSVWRLLESSLSGAKSPEKVRKIQKKSVKIGELKVPSRSLEGRAGVPRSNYARSVRSGPLQGRSCPRCSAGRPATTEGACTRHEKPLGSPLLGPY